MSEFTLLPNYCVAASASSIPGGARASPSDGPRLPVELINKAVRHLADDTSRVRSGLEKDLSACAEACRTLCHSARAVRFRKMDLKLIGHFEPKKLQDTIENWAQYAPIIAPHLRALTLDWNIGEVMSDKRVITAMKALAEKSPLKELYIKGPFQRFPDILYPLAEKDSIRCISFQQLRDIPQELVVGRDGLQFLQLLQAEVEVPPSVHLSNTMCFQFDLNSKRRSHGFRQPKSLLLQLDRNNPNGNVLIQTYCQDLHELTMNVFAKLKTLCLVFKRSSDFLTPFDVAQWLHITGATNLVTLRVVFEYDPADSIADIEEVLELLALQPRSPFEFAELFSQGNTPHLEITLKFPLLYYHTYKQDQLSLVQDEIQELADEMFDHGGVVTVRGLLLEGEDNLMYIVDSLFSPYQANTYLKVLVMHVGSSPPSYVCLTKDGRYAVVAFTLHIDSWMPSPVVDQFGEGKEGDEGDR
ncbi:hypothetical protein CVT26_012915 [Gymnopilus dilepis]|uniref:Uncharacterized protein n=1 Tax=Gymnopilus dilepis TaxID=231916 RepID=A0A409Y481_9AGAR|nr:hypothetical protein CVT26_012915 [Gymnopilus dilepis]